MSNLKGLDVSSTTSNAQPHEAFIYEPDAYDLVFGSKLESAKRFRKLV